MSAKLFDSSILGITARTKGAGLGLPICRRTVEEHSGTMNIQSWIGDGTTVCIVLPATRTGAKDSY